MGDDIHFKAYGTVRHHGANPAHANDPQGFVAIFVTHEFCFFPKTCFHRSSSLRYFARERHHHGDGVLGGGDGIAAWGVHDNDAVFAGGWNIDVINAGACATDGD